MEMAKDNEVLMFIGDYEVVRHATSNKNKRFSVAKKGVPLAYFYSVDAANVWLKKFAQ